LRPLHAVGCILTDITREPSSLHRLDVQQGYCHLQGFQGHYRERFPPGGYLKATIIAFCITLPQPPMIAELLNRLA
jgi:hypothetical protein